MLSAANSVKTTRLISPLTKKLSCPASVRAPTAQRSRIATMAAPLVYPQPIVMAPSGPHTSTMIMLHGLGDTGAGWQDIGYMYKGALPGTKFIFPNAPRRPITINFGMAMPGWYDIASLEEVQRSEDAEGLRESQRSIEGLREKEVAAGVPSSRVVVGGFGQGGRWRSSERDRLSAYLPLHTQQPVVSEANAKTPIFMCHGDADQTVAFAFGQRSYKLLSSIDANVEFQTYMGMGHSACQREFDDVLAFVKPILGA
ncbi:Acyl-protein thioesterase 1 [Tetrabaena socialis]|uniref:Acyl-protein thioesterase 1 n=1 Tax=Tetrabaena socialis TaxID=47790 RepID=A0A2J8AJH7_9CHLO|nr:Acyl-protein thioesterase 1 [Tetrabaena socialis]|eukprot:PNH12661.1 Acyl-protein thioesterase 1 [Tetrabaena socialis]